MIASLPLLVALPGALGMYYNNSQDYADGALGIYPSQTYRSSNITPPAWNVEKYPDSPPLPGYIFIAPRGTAVPSEQQGPMIFDHDGELVWSGSEVAGQTMSFEVFPYNGSDVIAVWTGQFFGGGYGSGEGLILNSSYHVIGTVNTSGLNTGADFHEFRLTDNNTALITAYEHTPYNLSSYGVQTDDPAGGSILVGHIQEIDVATGNVIFTWNALDHIDPSMSYADPGSTGTGPDNSWDYIHLNAIDKDAEGNYLVSARHTHAVYHIDKNTGEVLWTMNGKNSSFAMGNGSTYEWQHHARWRNNYTQISLFDNAATDFSVDEAQARGLLINLDMDSMSASLAVEALPYQHIPSPSQGSFDLLPDGNWIAGWGSEPFVSEHDANGNLLWAFTFGINTTQSYRAFISNWTAYPTTNPNLSVSTNDSTNSYDVYVSWNGATEVKLWNLYATSATDGSGLNFITSANKTGFETYMNVQKDSIGDATHFQIMAGDVNNKTLGYTEFRSTDGQSSSPVPAAESSSIASQSPPSQTSSATLANTSGAANQKASMGGMIPIVMGMGCVTVSLVMGLTIL